MVLFQPKLPALVHFLDLRPRYTIGEDILVVLEYAPGLEIGVTDWIGLFPVVWSDLNRFLCYQKAPQPRPCSFRGTRPLQTVVFHTKALKKEHLGSTSLNCQLVYVSGAFDAVLGSSPSFSMDHPLCNNDWVNEFQQLQMTNNQSQLYENQGSSLYASYDHLERPRYLFEPVLSPPHMNSTFPIRRRSYCHSENVPFHAYASPKRPKGYASYTEYESDILDHKMEKEGALAQMKRVVGEKIARLASAAVPKTDAGTETRLLQAPLMDAFGEQLYAFPPQQRYGTVPNRQTIELLKYQEQQNDYLWSVIQQMTREKAMLNRNVQMVRQQYLAVCRDFREQTTLLNSIYCTLNQKGFSHLRLKNGDLLDLSEFQGPMLELEQNNAVSLISRGLSRTSLNKELTSQNYGNASSNNDLKDVKNEHTEFLRKLMNIREERHALLDDYLDWLQEETVWASEKCSSKLANHESNYGAKAYSKYRSYPNLFDNSQYSADSSSLEEPEAVRDVGLKRLDPSTNEGADVPSADSAPEQERPRGGSGRAGASQRAALSRRKSRGRGANRLNAFVSARSYSISPQKKTRFRTLII